MTSHPPCDAVGGVTGDDGKTGGTAQRRADDSPDTGRDHAAETDDAARSVISRPGADGAATNERDRDAEVRDAAAADRARPPPTPRFPTPLPS